MKHATHLFISTMLFMVFANPVIAETAAVKNPVAIIHTSKGPITLELYADQAPITVANFIDYANSGHYTGSLRWTVRFTAYAEPAAHRVEPLHKRDREQLRGPTPLAARIADPAAGATQAPVF